MLIKNGDMFTCPVIPDNYLVTTNSILNNKNHLVMGAGAALQAKLKFKGIDKTFGKYIQLHGGSGAKVGCVPKLYGNVGMFQTKYHYGEASLLSLIEYSVETLGEFIDKWAKKEIFFLNFPGINHGRLKPDQVLPIIEKLPNNVIVWKL